MSKKFDLSKLSTHAPKQVVKKGVSTDEAVSAIHAAKAVRTSLDIPEDIHKRLKLLSVNRGISMKDLMLQFFVEGLDAMERG